MTSFTVNFRAFAATWRFAAALPCNKYLLHVADGAPLETTEGGSLGETAAAPDEPIDPAAWDAAILAEYRKTKRGSCEWSGESHEWQPRSAGGKWPAISPPGRRRR